jgi:2-isopropylmalate synthase
MTLIPTLALKLQRVVLPEGHLEELREVSLFVDEIANQRPNPRAPYVGQTSFAHKGGQHVNAIHKVIHSYEHIRPELVGNSRRILVGEQSGRTNLMLKARELNIPLDEKSPSTKTILELMKQREADGYEYEAADASFVLLVRSALEQLQPLFSLIEYHVAIREVSGQQLDSCVATVKMEVNGEQVDAVENGDGPVNALDTALRKALGRFYPQISEISLTDYKVRIIDSGTGTAAKTRVFIESTDGHRTWTTVGVSPNIVEASWHALTESIEYFIRRF